MQFVLYTSRKIRNVLHRNTNGTYKKLKGKPSRSKRCFDTCLNFERKHLTAGTDWRDVVFSNEKKFHLDGPSEFNVYWYNMHKEKLQFGGVMVWAAFEDDGGMEVENKMNSVLYQDILPGSLLPVTPLNTSGDLTFQQINASDAYSVLILYEGE
ncbi:hypothetical protein AVEN_73084-1 [Araneus ventricosus]|uniref:Uncharacterized protein n=1 Tax=Araneus ventricosus TaxID=182803 RepID=A0A4Y2IZF1_ARAVE|nr:hypothetical protein AVEN_73084-1 [Araneus ventricosus]